MSSTNRETFINHYATLGVDPRATPDEIRSAFRKLSLTHHPDKAARGSKDAIDDANAAFVQISAAYSILRDPAKRRDFDTLLRLRERDLVASGSGYGYGPPPPAPPQPPPPSFQPGHPRRTTGVRPVCPDCASLHGPGPVRDEVHAWIRNVLVPQRLSFVRNDLADMSDRVAQMSEWFARRRERERERERGGNRGLRRRAGLGSQARDALDRLVDRIDDEGVRVMALARRVWALGETCAPEEKRGEMVREVARVVSTCRRWMEAEMTVGRYWEVLKGANAEEWEILYDTFLDLVERWIRRL